MNALMNSNMNAITNFLFVIDMRTMNCLPQLLHSEKNVQYTVYNIQYCSIQSKPETSKLIRSNEGVKLMPAGQLQ